MAKVRLLTSSTSSSFLEGLAQRSIQNPKIMELDDQETVFHEPTVLSAQEVEPASLDDIPTETLRSRSQRGQTSGLNSRLLAWNSSGRIFERCVTNVSQNLTRFLLVTIKKKRHQNPPPTVGSCFVAQG